MKKRILGFTLIELLIVITIIGILAAVFVPSVMDAPKKSRDAARIANISVFSGALANAQLAGEDLSGLTGGDASTVLSSISKYFQGTLIPSDPQDATDIDGGSTPSVFSAGKYAVVKYTVATKVYLGFFAKVENPDNGNTGGTLALPTGCPTAISAAALPSLTATVGACFGIIYAM